MRCTTKTRLFFRGEVILSSIKSCCERRKCESFEQKADGRFLARLKRSCIEIGHLEMSGGYGHREIPRSTWDGCCKGPLGNMYRICSRRSVRGIAKHHQSHLRTHVSFSCTLMVNNIRISYLLISKFIHSDLYFLF